MRPILFSRVLLALIAAAWLPSAFCQDDKKKPLFRELLHGKTYARALAELDQERTDLTALSKSRLPAEATKIASVTPGGIADKLGMRAGMFLVKLDGKKVWHHQQDLNLGKAGRELEMLTAEGIVKKLKIPAGKIGFMHGHYLRPELVYMRSKKFRGAAWDQHVVNAVVAWRYRKRAAAETAWFHAMAAGMPGNPIAAYYASIIAFERGDMERAEKFARYVLHQYPRRTLPKHFLQGLQTIALSKGSLTLLERIADESDGVLGPDKQLLANWKKWGAPKPGSLLERARKRRGDNVLATTTSIKQHNYFHGEFTDNKRIRGGRFIVRNSPGFYEAMFFGTQRPMRNAILYMNFELGGTWKPVQKSLNSYTVALVDAKQQPEALREAWRKDPNKKWSSGDVATLYFYELDDGLYGVTVSGGPAGGRDFSTEIRLPVLKHKEVVEMFVRRKAGKNVFAEKKHRLQIYLVRLDNEIEIRVNGRVLLHLPADPAVGQLAVYTHSSGTGLFVNTMTLRPADG